ncbi:MAG TPA: hypothetical protein VMR44_07325 [Thermoanaerobaculia bacterium]|nr:hypothetical protein [Thermoanaerobaculia bacterium]
MPYRPSPYIDFEAGRVLTPPMVLSQQRTRPWSSDDMLDLFECRVDVWQLGPAVEILKDLDRNAPNPASVWAHGAYALLGLVFTYFEMIGKTLNLNSRPSGTAWIDFNYGFCDVYPSFAPPPGADFKDSTIPDVAAFRDRVRNGIYHLGYTKGNLFLWNEPSQADFVVDRRSADPRYLVNPHGATRTIMDHFPGFIGRVRASAPLRKRFERFFKEFHGLK